jgi:hypothetical protein
VAAAADPTGTKLNLDIIAHSRGGLVSRILAGQCEPLAVPANIKVNKIAFAGTPNDGTEIVNVKKWGALIDRLTNMIKLVQGELHTPAVFLADVLEVLKAAASDTALHLPGLECMTPLSALLTSLNGSLATPPLYYAIDTDFRPNDFLHNIFNLQKDFVDGAEVLVDHAVFEHVTNDVAVPTNGIGGSDVNALGFPVPEPNTHHFAKTQYVWHCSYYGQSETAQSLLSWFGA